MAGRNKSIDREHAIISAERIVRERGSAELTHGNLAEEAGISKGGVQSCFGTKDGLLEALLQRWITHLDQGIRTETGAEPKPLLLRHIQAQLNRIDENSRHMPSLLASLSKPDKHREPLREWYRMLESSAAPEIDLDRNMRLAFLACEGLTLLYHLGIMHFTDESFQAARQDILTLVCPDDEL